MSARELIQCLPEGASLDDSGDELLKSLIEASTSKAVLPPPSGAVIGELVGLSDDGDTPLVVYSGQPGSAAVAARSIVDLSAAHIGKSIVLMFDQGGSNLPIVMGLLRGGGSWPTDESPTQVELFADGERLIVGAHEELVLRCGTASITLTKAGKVLIRGTYLSSWSSGVNRVKGGSVQIN